MNVALTSLWLPIMLSAIAVFFVSSLIWTVVQWHNSDWHKLPDEDAVRKALSGTPPGLYNLPHAAHGKDRASEEWQAKFRAGPAAMLTVVPHGTLSMGKQLGQWMLYCLIISTLVAYVAAASLSPGTEYLKVFQVTSTTAWLAYGGAVGMNYVWFGGSGGKAIKDVIDALVYALVTAGFFGWLWP